MIGRQGGVGIGRQGGVGRGVVALFAASAATLEFDDGTVATAAELAAGSNRAAAALVKLGIGPGDRVALRMPNSPDYVRALLGCAALGVVAVSVNTRYSDAEADDLVRRSRAHLVVRAGDVLDAHGEGEVLAGGMNDPFVVFTTSGTTSRPKMVLHHQRSIVEHAHDVAAAFGYVPADVVLVAMPLCGTFGLASLMGAVAGGSRVVVTDYDTARTADLIAGRRVTCANGSDDMFHRLLEHGADLSTIRLGGYARFNTSLDGIVGRAEAKGATLVGLYGMSEVQALYSVRDPGAPAYERERAGGRLVSRRAEYRVVDDELQLRGPSLFAGYLAEGGSHLDEELIAQSFDAGWFRTGDVATADDDSTFEYVTRAGDVLRLGGFLVSPTEIEAALTELPAVDAAQVVAVDRPGGARPVAFVIAPGGVDEEATVAHCRERLARYKVPVRVLTVDEFPTIPSANGTKIQKVKLRELARAALEA